MVFLVFLGSGFWRGRFFLNFSGCFKNRTVYKALRNLKLIRGLKSLKWSSISYWHIAGTTLTGVRIEQSLVF